MRFNEKLTQITLIILTLCIGFSFAGLVAEYKFEGDGKDETGIHNADIAGKATCVDVVGDELQGMALTYNPAPPWQTQDDFFKAPDHPDFDLVNLTLEAWIKLVAYPSNQYRAINIIARWAANHWNPITTEERSYVFNVDQNGRIHFIISPDGFHTGTTKELVSVASLTIGEWNHVAATFDGTTMRIYINGVESNSMAAPGLVPHDGIAPLCIGIDSDGFAPMYCGFIDNAKIHDVALTPGEVAAASVRLPFADAGPDQAITIIGTTVELDGSDSWDPMSNPLTFLWEITQKPDGSLAELNDETSPTPTFIADKNGPYTIQLVVSNDWASSLADEIVVSFSNIKPVADAGENQSGTINETFSLNGSESYDLNHDDLEYNWQIAEKPEGSSPVLNAVSYEASLTPDLPGEYVLSLTVNDGIVDSDPDEVTIAVISVEDATTETLQEATDVISILPTSDFKNKKMAKTTTNMINSVLLKIDNDDIEGAYNQLKNAILKKTDGCAERGAPDKNDWIKDCESQEAVYQTLIEALDLLYGLLP